MYGDLVAWKKFLPRGFQRRHCLTAHVLAGPPGRHSPFLDLRNPNMAPCLGHDLRTAAVSRFGNESMPTDLGTFFEAGLSCRTSEGLTQESRLFQSWSDVKNKCLSQATRKANKMLHVGMQGTFSRMEKTCSNT